MKRASQYFGTVFLIIVMVLPTTGFAQSVPEATAVPTGTLEVISEGDSSVPVPDPEAPVLIESPDVPEEQGLPETAAPTEPILPATEFPDETPLPTETDTPATEQSAETPYQEPAPETAEVDVTFPATVPPTETLVEPTVEATQVSADESGTEVSEPTQAPATAETITTPTQQLSNPTNVDPPAVTLSHTIGPAGAKITMTGEGFTPEVEFPVCWDTPVCEPTPSDTAWLGSPGARPDGTFRMDIHIPADAQPGSYTIFAVKENNETAEASFTVTDHTVSTDVATGSIEDEVIISGVGLLPGEAFKIKWNSIFVWPMAEGTIDRVGNFSQSIRVPDDAIEGSVVIYIESGGLQFDLSFTVTENSQPAVASMQLDPISGVPGDRVGVRGDDFTPGEPVNIHWGSEDGPFLGSKNATTTGTFSGAILVPKYASSGFTDIYLKSDTHVVSATFDVTAPPQATITVSPTTGNAGDRIGIIGYNFTPGEPVNIHWGSEDGPFLGSKIATNTGAFSGAILVPATASPGVTAIYLKNATQTTSASFNVTTPPQATVSVSPTTALPGARLSVTGTNFSPDERVNIHWGSATGPILGYKNATSTGAFSGAILVPSSATAGGTSVWLVSQSGSASTAFTVQALPKAKIIISYNSFDEGNTGPQGTVIGIQGWNYTPGELVTISWPGGAVIGRLTARADGSISGAVTVPLFAYSGPNTIAARGGSSGFFAGAGFTVVSDPWVDVVLSSSEGPGNSIVRFSGVRFKPGEMVDITFPGFPALGHVKAGPTGSISGAIKIPGGGASLTLQYITFKGRSGGQSTDVQYMVTKNVSSMTVSRSSIAAGTIISFSGTGYRPGTDAYIYINCLEPIGDNFLTSNGGCGILGMVKVSPTGTISGRVTIPSYLHTGSYRVYGIGFGQTNGGPYGMTGHSASAPIRVTTSPTPTARLYTTSGAANRTVGATFSGFHPYDYVCFYDSTENIELGCGNVGINGQLEPGTLGTRNSNGQTIREGVFIPANAPLGNYQMLVKGDFSRVTLRVTYRVTSTSANHQIAREEYAQSPDVRERLIG